jgi:hypothetical protein
MKENQPMKYRKKPAVIEAVQLTESRALKSLTGEDPFPFGLHVYGQFNKKHKTVHHAYVMIETLEGTMKGCLGDWIIKGVKGELYPCKPDIFEATYEREGK